MCNVGDAGAVAGRCSMLAGIGKAAKRAMGEKAIAQFKKRSRKALVGKGIGGISRSLTHSAEVTQASNNLVSLFEGLRASLEGFKVQESVKMNK